MRWCWHCHETISRLPNLLSALFRQIQMPLLLFRQIPLIYQFSSSFSCHFFQVWGIFFPQFVLSNNTCSPMSSAHMQSPPHTMSSPSPRFSTIFLVIQAPQTPSKIQPVFLLPVINFQYWLPYLTVYLSWPILHTEMPIRASAVFVLSSCLEPARYLVNSLFSIAAACSNNQT